LTIRKENLKLALEPNRRERFAVLETPQSLGAMRRFRFLQQKLD
jgi:hypothetical protein